MKIQLSNKQNIFFCSDPHYGHSGIVMGTSNWDDKSGCRPFNTIEDMNEALVSNINEVVKEDDILFCLGDWSFGSYKTGDNVSNISEFRERLHCKTIHLLLGNHDSEIEKEMISPFSSVSHYREIIVIEQPIVQGEKAIKQKIVLSHYSHRVWNNMHNGAWMLFGHSHGNLKSIEGKTMDVGFDTNSLKPYSYDDIKNIMKGKEFVGFDHHILK